MWGAGCSCNILPRSLELTAHTEHTISLNSCKDYASTKQTAKYTDTIRTDRIELGIFIRDTQQSLAVDCA